MGSERCIRECVCVVCCLLSIVCSVLWYALLFYVWSVLLARLVVGDLMIVVCVVVFVVGGLCFALRARFLNQHTISYRWSHHQKRPENYCLLSTSDAAVEYRADSLL